MHTHMRPPAISAFACTAALALFFIPRPPQADHLAEYKAQFERETNPVRKAKLLVKMSDPQFQIIRTEAESNPDDGLRDLEAFRDECYSTHEALKAKGVNPENKSAGYKELEISVRESLHRLREIVAGLTGDDEKHYAKVRSQLEALNNELIKELFPRQPGSTEKPNPKP